MEGVPLNLFDAAILFAVLVSALLALLRGFTREMLAIAAWIGAAFATLKLFPPLQPIVRAHMSPLWLADLALGAGLFVVVLVLLSVISHFLADRVRGSRVGPLDRSLGFLFGLARGVVLAVLVYAAIDRLLPVAERPVWLREARLAVPLQSGAEYLLDDLLGGLRTQSPAGGIEAVPVVPAPRPPMRDAGASAPERSPWSRSHGPNYQAAERQALDRLFEKVQNER